MPHPTRHKYSSCEASIISDIVVIMRGLLFISVFVLGLVYTQATGRLECIPNYVKCRDSATTEEQRDDCIWKFVSCIKEDCDTHVCDGYGKECLKAATTHEGKHVCALQWFRCVQKMHRQICHTKEPESIATVEKSVTFGSGRDCEKAYIKCRYDAKSEDELDKCLWKFVYCIKEDCDTHVCDATGKQCLKKATTHADKHICAFNWFKCVEKMHKQICHVPREQPDDEPMNWFGKHKHRSTTTQSPHTITPSKQTPSMCYSNLKRCHAHAHTTREEGACIKSYATCMKRMCKTGSCDSKAKACMKRAKTTGQKLRCAYGWIKCVRSSEHRICRRHYELEDENIFGHHHHKHFSSTTQKPSVTPARCGCYCQYTHCNAHARTVREKDACIKSYKTCVKRICDTRKCDKKTDKCMKKAKTHDKQHRCQVDWFKCVKKYQKKICHKRA